MSQPPMHSGPPPAYDAPNHGAAPAPIYYPPPQHLAQPQYVVQATPLSPQQPMQPHAAAAPPAYNVATSSPAPVSNATNSGVPGPALAAAILSTARFVPENNCWHLHFHHRNGRMSFMDGEGNIMFCMEPRPSQMIIAFNSCFGDQWGSQEQMYIPIDPNPIDAFVSITPEAFLVNIRGMPEKKFLHRANPASFSGNVIFSAINDTYVSIDREPPCCIVS